MYSIYMNIYQIYIHIYIQFLDNKILRGDILLSLDSDDCDFRLLSRAQVMLLMNLVLFSGCHVQY